MRCRSHTKREANEHESNILVRGIFLAVFSWPARPSAAGGLKEPALQAELQAAAPEDEIRVIVDSPRNPICSRCGTCPGRNAGHSWQGK